MVSSNSAVNDKNRNAAGIAMILSIMCPLVYFASYLTRKNYGVVMSEIIVSEGISNGIAGLAGTLLSVTYGIGQVLSGILADKTKPRLIVFLGMLASSVINLIFPLCPSPVARALMWGLNGLAQAMVWPPMVLLLSSHMDIKRYNDACTNVSLAGIGGTVVVYLAASLFFIPVLSWKYVFFASGLVGAVITILWLILTKGIDAKAKKIETQETKTGENANEKSKVRVPASLLWSSGFIFVMIAIIAQGALRDGVNDWVPSLVISIFDVGSASAILKAVVLPIIALISLKISGVVGRKFVKNEVTAAAVAFALCLAFCVALIISFGKNEIAMIILSALICAMMHAANFFLICICPARFEKFGLVGTMSGVINAGTYVGSAAATYGFGLFSDSFGWQHTIMLWAVIAAAGLVFSIAAIRPWKNKMI